MQYMGQDELTANRWYSCELRDNTAIKVKYIGKGKFMSFKPKKRVYEMNYDILYVFEEISRPR